MARTREIVATAILIALASPLGLAAQHGGGGADAEAIEAVITSAYIEGIHKNGSREAIREGFHPGFVMKVLDNGRMVGKVFHSHGQ